MRSNKDVVMGFPEYEADSFGEGKHCADRITMVLMLGLFVVNAY
jgi:hypothetical protein